ncbi:hypothetical protein [Chelativorans sp. M5D2P16]|uniref:hypothetical protein n=1 Tax=Chelativorans sp. M5D2P16 TaxID=3095678 RepID=UPI002ACA1C8E|nr:hypothetical protein [Chelativorans sp. M5D2P16]MDZ5697003.1 hypothetical protein [Chelativorans sp. M5D2P16]
MVSLRAEVHFGAPVLWREVGISAPAAFYTVASLETVAFATQLANDSFRGALRVRTAGLKRQAREQFQEKWKPVFRPELAGRMVGSVHRFSAKR